MEHTSEPEFTFRFDDICLNTDQPKLASMIAFIKTKAPTAHIILAVSPAVHDEYIKLEETERVFPKMFHVESDFRVFYRPNRVGVPGFLGQYMFKSDFKLAAHGLIHVDHRLLPRCVQELSIVMSCSLVDTDMFVPPFHKWNKDTEEVCAEHRIKLVKYVAGEWAHLKYRPFNRAHKKYYLHTHDFTIETFRNQFP